MTAPATLLGRSGAVNVLTAAKGGACEGKPLECLENQTENHTEPHLCSSTPKPELEAPRCWIPCCQHGTVLMVVILGTYFSAANGIFRKRYTNMDGDIGGCCLVRMDDATLWALALSVGLAGWAALWLWLVAPTGHLLDAARFLMITWLGGLCLLRAEFQWRETLWWVEFLGLQYLALERFEAIWSALGATSCLRCLAGMWCLEVVLVVCGFIVKQTAGRLPAIWVLGVAYLLGGWVLIYFMMMFCGTVFTLQRAMRTARKEANTAAMEALLASRRDAFLQGIGFLASYATTQTLSYANSFLGLFEEYHSYFAAQCVNIVVNVVGVLLLSNAYKLLACCGSARPPALPWFRCSTCPRIPDLRHDIAGKGSQWIAKTVDLATRGIFLADLIAFYKQIFDPAIMSFKPSVHTTNDVVRLAIIPLTSSTCSSYAELLNRRHKVVPSKMVTHNWSNLFRDLVASVVAHALGEHSFDFVAELLSDMEGTKVVEEALLVRGLLEKTYWICAFAVNQHAGICGENPKRDIDPVTQVPHPTCPCSTPKFFNKDPPLNKNGESIHCEMNKFDDMMALLAEHNSWFEEVVAVDANLDLFGRAWCVAELAEAYRRGMDQKLMLKSKTILLRRQCTLEGLQVENMQASRPEDVQHILAKIPDKQAFNQDLKKLIFDRQEGLLAAWKKADVLQQMEELSHVLRWADLSREIEDGGLIWRRWPAPAPF